MNKSFIIGLFVFVLLVGSVSALVFNDTSSWGGNFTAASGVVYDNAGGFVNVTKGTNNFLNLSRNITINRAYNYTWSTWVKLKSYDADAALTHQPLSSLSANWGSYLKPQANRVTGFIKNSTGIEQNDIYLSMTSAWKDTWHHVLVRTNVTRISYCIDGVCSTAPDALSGQTGITSSAFYISTTAQSTSFNGSIDNVYVWENVSLSDAQVLDVFNNLSVEPDKLIVAINFTNSSSESSSCTTPSSGLTLTTNTTLCSGSYSLGGTGLIIGADGITVTCNNTRLVGVDETTNAYKGFFTNGYNNIVIQNCNVTTYKRGILVFNSINVTLRNNYFTFNSIGIDFDNSSYSLASNNSFYINSDNIRTLNNASYNRVDSNFINRTRNNALDNDGLGNNFTNNIVYAANHSAMDVCGLEHLGEIMAWNGLFENNTIYNGPMFYSCYGENMTIRNNVGYNISTSNTGADNGFGVERYANDSFGFIIENNTIYQGVGLTHLMDVAANAIVRNNKFNGTIPAIYFSSYYGNPDALMVNLTFINNTMLDGSAIRYVATYENQTNVSIYQNSSYNLSSDSTAGDGTYYVLYAYGDINDAKYSNGSVIQNNFVTLKGYLANGLTLSVGNFNATNVSPVISNLVSSVVNNSVVITFDSDLLTNSSINYGSSLALGSRIYNSSNDTSHTFYLSGLAYNTLYYFNVSVFAASGLSDIEASSFTTESLSVPLIIYEPVNNSNINQFLNVSWNNVSLANYYSISLNGLEVAGSTFWADTTSAVSSSTSYVVLKNISLTSSSNKFVDDVIFAMSAVSPNTDHSARLVFYYSDGSSNITPEHLFGDSSWTIFNQSNLFPSKAISFIVVEGKRGTSTFYSKDVNFTSYLRGTNVSINLYPFNLSIGSYIVNVSAFNDSRITSNTTYINLLSNALLNVSVSAYNGSSIDEVTFTIRDVSRSSSSSYTTDNGFYNLHFIKGDTYNISFEDSDYAFNSSFYVANQSIQQYLSFILYPYNAIIFRTYLNSISTPYNTTTTTIRLDSDSNTYNLVTNSTGFASLDNVIPGTYLITYNNAIYGLRQRVLNFPEGSFSNVSLILGNGTEILFNFKDTGGNVIPNLLCELFLSVDSNEPSQSGYSDVSGRLQFLLITDDYNRIVCSNSSYITYSFVLNPVYFTSYTITLSSSSVISVLPTGYASFSPTNFYNGMNSSFNLKFISNGGNFEYYNYSIAYLSNSYSGFGNNDYSESFTIPINLPEGSSSVPIVFTYAFILSDGTSVQESFTFLSIPVGQKTLVKMGVNRYGMLVGDRVILITLILILVIGTIWIYSGSLMLPLIFGGAIVWVMAQNGFLGADGAAAFNLFIVAIIAYVVLRAWYNR